MEKLDRLGWAAGLSFVSHGTRIGIRVNDPRVMEQIRPLLPYGAKPAGSDAVDDLFSLIVGPASTLPGLRHYNILYWGSARIARSFDLDGVLTALQSSLHFAVAMQAQPWLFVHAGVVGWHGRAIVIPGRSMSGKSTLVSELVRAGADYYSDE